MDRVSVQSPAACGPGDKRCPLDNWLAILTGHASCCALSVARFNQGRWRAIVVDVGTATRQLSPPLHEITWEEP